MNKIYYKKSQKKNLTFYYNMSDQDVKNQDLGDDEIPQTPRPKIKKGINITDEERAKRSERMKKLRAKLDNIGKKPVADKKEEIKKKPPTLVKEKKITKKEEKEEENNDYSENSDVLSDESDEEPTKPLPKTKKIEKPIANTKRKQKPVPRKVMKIKYYHEPSQAEMLQDRLFLENQHKADNEIKYLKKKELKPTDDLSDKLFNY